MSIHFWNGSGPKLPEEGYRKLKAVVEGLSYAGSP
jgi:hypothetical protein